MNNIPTLATSSWCEPCKQLKKQLKETGVTVDIVDMTENTDYFLKHKIRSVPTLILETEEKIVGFENILLYLNK